MELCREAGCCWDGVKGDGVGITRGAWGHGGVWGWSSNGHSRLGGLICFSRTQSHGAVPAPSGCPHQGAPITMVEETVQRSSWQGGTHGCVLGPSPEGFPCR